MRLGNLFNTDQPTLVEPWMLLPDSGVIFIGIPLTEEWLIKLGFTLSNTHNMFYDLGKLTINMPDQFHKKGRVYFNSWAIIDHMPEFVHQLQNLYFALTGEELLINTKSV